MAELLIQPADPVVEYEAERERGIIDGLDEEYGDLNDKIERLQKGLEYKKELREKYFKKLEKWYGIESGESYQKVSAEESEKLINEGVKGIKKYLTSKGNARLRAAENALKQVKSLENIYEAQNKYLEASEKIDEIIGFISTLEKQINGRREKIEEFRKRQGEINKEIDERTISITDILDGFKGWLDERLRECRSYRSNLIDEITAGRWNRRDVQNCVGEGEGRTCTTTQITECLANIRKVCAGSPPFSLCKCSTQTAMRFNVVVQSLHCGPLPPF